MEEYLLRREEERLCKKYGGVDLKAVLGIQYDILRHYYRSREHRSEEDR